MEKVKRRYLFNLLCNASFDAILFSDNTNFTYVGCFNHEAGGNVDNNFLDSLEYGVDSAGECWESCKDQGWKYFGITDSDCAGAGKQADCHCGMTLPTEQYDIEECLKCTDSSGNEYHCGRCGWKLDIYEIRSGKRYPLE